MTDAEQVSAYHQTDFSEAHDMAVQLMTDRLNLTTDDNIRILDLGCGTGDVIIRMAKKLGKCTIHGVDGSEPMLNQARGDIDQDAQLTHRIQLICSILPDIGSLSSPYDLITSNSLLHHLNDPMILWEVIALTSSKNNRFFIMDLIRPDTEEEARVLTERHAKNEHPVLKKDFYHSLCAAYTPDEVQTQCQRQGLVCTVEVVSDRHMIIYH